MREQLPETRMRDVEADLVTLEEMRSGIKGLTSALKVFIEGDADEIQS